MADETTKVRFDFWTVLGFLVVLMAACLGYLFTAQGTNRDESRGAIQAVSDRTTKLEMQYVYIVEGINELKKGQKDVAATLQTLGR